MDKSTIKRLAIQCGTEFTQYKQVNFTYEFTPSQLEQFAQAVIAEFVKEQKPVAKINVTERKLEFMLPTSFDNLASCAVYPDIPLFTLDGVKP